MMESMFIAFEKVGEEVEWLQNFLKNISCWLKLVPIIYVRYDSQSSIGRAQNSICNGKSTHVRHIHNIVKHLLSNKITYIDYVKSKENIVNLLTKGLLRELVYNSSRKIGLKPLKIKECNDGNHTLCTGDFKIYVLIKN